jgi:mono/diheme cytochrome c family protein
VLVLVAGVLAACGSHGGSGATQLQRGRAVYRHACAGCHTLTGHDTSVPGGDLAIAKLSPAVLAGFVRVMPVRLSAADTDAVAAYVHAVAAGEIGR